MNKYEKTYLGDSVYAVFDNIGITLTTENGIDSSNTIYFEPGIIKNFLLFLCDVNLDFVKKTIAEFESKLEDK